MRKPQLSRKEQQIADTMKSERCKKETINEMDAEQKPVGRGGRIHADSYSRPSHKLRRRKKWKISSSEEQKEKGFKNTSQEACIVTLNSGEKNKMSDRVKETFQHKQNASIA